MLMVGVAGLWLLPVTASAHDQLLSSTPVPGQHLATAPSQVQMRYSDDIVTIGALVVVTDAAGANHAAPTPALDGSTVTVDLDRPLSDGVYEVRWRVVSGDGHPISGVIPFTVGDAAPSPSTTSTASASPPAGSAASAETGGSVLGPVVVGALVVGGGVGLLLLLSRRRRT